MSCDQFQEQILDHDWDERRLRLAAQIAAHVEQCEPCRLALHDYDRLRQALSVDDEQLDAAPPIEAVGAGAAPRRRLVFGLAIAAAVILAVSAGWLYQAERGGGNSARLAADAALRLSPAEIDQRVELFRNVSEVFDGRAAWVAEVGTGAGGGGGGDPDIGLIAARPAVANRLLLLRLAVNRGGQAVSTADIVILPGRSADLTIPFEHGRKLRYRLAASADRPTRLSLWAELVGPDGHGEPLAALATTLTPSPGQVLTAGRLTTRLGAHGLEVAFTEAKIAEVQP